MKKVINGKMYNTETAKEIGHISYGNVGDFEYWDESLYQKKTGELFLAGDGGPASKHIMSCGKDSWIGGSKIIPFTDGEACEWIELNNMGADAYAKAFGEVE